MLWGPASALTTGPAESVPNHDRDPDPTRPKEASLPSHVYKRAQTVVTSCPVQLCRRSSFCE